MTETMSSGVKPSRGLGLLLNLSPISRIRRNHGLEHATLNVLAGRLPNLALAGQSDIGGFWILGDVEIEFLASCVEEALNRLRNGEPRLAVHEHCGTNFVTAGSLAGLAAWAAMFGVGKSFRDKVERLPMIAVFATLAVMLAQPLGWGLQEHITTSGEPGALKVERILESTRGRIKVHRVVTSG